MGSARYLKALCLLLTTLVCAGCGPRMRITPAIKPYEQKMPNMPGNNIPTNGTLSSYTAQQAKLASNPAGNSKTTLDNGKIFYGYYCVQCHGTDGSGDGPVGQSYVPKPTDLSSSAVTGMSDGELYRAMLFGTGHSPVMDQTVLIEQRWPLVAYVRTLGQERR